MKYYIVTTQTTKSTDELKKYLDEIDKQQWITIVDISEEEEKEENE